MRTRIIPRLALLSLAALASPSGAAEPLDSALKRPVIGPRLTQDEVQHEVGSRIPAMPQLTTADDWKATASEIRRAMLERVVFRGQAAAWRDSKVSVVMLDEIKPGPGYSVRKLRYEALPGLWVPALLYLPENVSGKVPASLNVNGHDQFGKQAPYKQIRCINMAKKGMIALNVEWFNMGQFRGPDNDHGQINHIDLCGTSGIAAHYLLMSKAVDLLLSLEHVDPERIVVTGLSGGGWQTIFYSSLDPRVGMAVPVAGYSSNLTRIRHFSDLGDSEQTPTDMATVADYTHLTALLAPRPSLLIHNAKDECCFASGHALPPLLEAAAPVFKLLGHEANLRTHINHDPGTHNYLLDNRQAFYKAIDESFYGGKGAFGHAEIPSDDEVLSVEATNVPLPEGNATLHSLALKLAEGLPNNGTLPGARPDIESWQAARAAEVKEAVRWSPFEARAEDLGSQLVDGLASTRWKLRVGSTWTVPAVELTRGEPTGTSILLVDSGRASPEATERAEALLAAGRRVVAIDPFLLGEAAMDERAYLWALLVATIGERPLGVQAAQVGAAAKWLAGPRALGPVEVVAVGPRASTIALVAAVAEPGSIGSLQLHQSLGSLKELIETRALFAKSPELFCFGLLERADIPQLAALVAPRPVTFIAPGDRVRKETTGLAALYKTLGIDHNPTP